MTGCFWTLKRGRRSHTARRARCLKPASIHRSPRSCTASGPRTHVSNPRTHVSKRRTSMAVNRATAVGAFVVGGLALAALAVVLFSSVRLFRPNVRAVIYFQDSVAGL